MKKFSKIIKFIVIAILIFLIGGVVLTKCTNCKKNNETAVAYAAEEDISVYNVRAANNSIDFKNSLSSNPYYHYENTLDTDGGNVLYYLSLYNYPKNQPMTIEVINNNDNDYGFQVLGDNSWSNVLINKNFTTSVYLTISSNDLSKFEFISIHIGKPYQFQNVQLNLDFYFYAGEYVPGYGQGLAAGLQQGKAEGKTEGYNEGYAQGVEAGRQEGYQSGYNQGAADTAEKYGLGVFRNSEAKYAYTNNISTLSYNSFKNNTLNLNYNGKVFFTNYALLNTSFSYYYLYVVFETPIILNLDTFYFTFPGAISEAAIPRINFFNTPNVEDFDGNLENSKFLFTIQSGKPAGTFGLAIMPGNNESGYFGQQYNKMLIRVEGSNAYNYLQGLQISTIATGDSSYFTGFNNGYNEGYNAGNEEGYQSGSQVGEQIKKDYYNLGYGEGEAQGYANAVSEGASAMGLFTGAVSLIKVFFQLLTGFLETKIAGDISLGLLVVGLPAAFMIVNLAIGLVKKLLGARGASEGGDDS